MWHICQKGITPLMMDAIKIQRTVFGYLYPAFVQIGCREQFAYFETRPVNKDLIPWLFSVSVFSGAMGVGGIAFLLMMILSNGERILSTGVHWNPFEGVILFVSALGTMMEIMSYVAMLLTPDVLTAFTAIQMIEEDCKFEYINH